MAKQHKSELDADARVFAKAPERRGAMILADSEKRQEKGGDPGQERAIVPGSPQPPGLAPQEMGTAAPN